MSLSLDLIATQKCIFFCCLPSTKLDTFISIFFVLILIDAIEWKEKQEADQTMRNIDTKLNRSNLILEKFFAHRCKKYKMTTFSLRTFSAVSEWLNRFFFSLTHSQHRIFTLLICFSLEESLDVYVHSTSNSLLLFIVVNNFFSL